MSRRAALRGLRGLGLAGLLWAASASAALAAGSCPTAARIQACSGPKSPKEFVASIVDTHGYDQSLRPPCGNATHAGPTVVEVQLYLTQLNNVDQKLGHLAMNGYLRSWWNDPRLAFNDTTQGGCFDEISMNGPEGEAIWLPDLYIDNLVWQRKEGFATLTEIYPDGSVWRSEQALFTVKGAMHLGSLPYDAHVAEVILASYSQSTQKMRVIPRGGVVGEGKSGVGLIASPISSAVWQLPEGAEENGFETKGHVQVKGGWDYVKLSFTYERDPKFFIDQVILPSVLFLIVSYIQFFVDPSAAPARAALAVIPVLIMRTMGNSVYNSLPEGSQQMWLADSLQISMFLSVLGSVEFGLVQLCLMKEKKRAAKLTGLKTVQKTAHSLIKESRQRRVPLLDVLNKHAPTERDVTADSPASQAQKQQAEPSEQGQAALEGVAEEYPAVVAPTPNAGVARSEQLAPSASMSMAGGEPSFSTGRVASKHAVDDGVKEADLLFIQYALKIFVLFDADHSNKVSVTEVRKALTYFNIYMSHDQTSTAICIFLRDNGEITPLDERKVQLSFSNFCCLLLDIEKYMLTQRIREFSLRSLRGRFQRIPPSRRVDLMARVVFPLLMILHQVSFRLMLPLYEVHGAADAGSA